MWANEQEAGVALRALTEEPAPPAVITLDQVIRRGRRRVRGQRLGVLAVVVAVLVAGAGAALALWPRRPLPEPGAAGFATTLPWPEQIPGWSVVEPAPCDAPAAGPAVGAASLMRREVLEPTLVAGVEEVTGGPAKLTRADWAQGDMWAYLEIEVSVEHEFGSVLFEAKTAGGGPPSAAADADVDVYGFCSVPLRRTLESGAVLQLYAPDARSPSAPVQHLRTYLPNGRLYVVSSAGWIRADEQGGVVRTGRGRLPLDGQQLADVAMRVAELN